MEKNKNKLRIAVWHNLPSGGGKRALYDHISGLINRGHYVESWCPDTSNQEFLPLSEIIRENVIPVSILNPFRKRKIYDIFKDYNTVLSLSKALDRVNQQCAKEINDGNFDIIFANACYAFRTSSIAKYLNIPSVVYLGEPYRWYYEALPEIPWIAPKNKKQKEDKNIIEGIRLQARIELDYAKSFDKILVNSIYSRESILRAYNLESSVCYLGIDTEKYSPTGEKKEKIVVGLGTIYHAKGIDRAIEAISTIEKSIRPKLIWIGNGAWQNDLQKYNDMSKKLGVNFIAKINISDKEVVSYLSKASSMIYTSRLEPFGLAPLEANACGTPVVAIAEGGVKETVKNGINGFLVQENNPNEIGEIISMLCNNLEKSVELGKKSREYVISEWKKEKGIDNIENLFYSLI